MAAMPPSIDQCCCHPVSFMIAAIVVPCGRLNIAITLACLVAARVAYLSVG
jgi:hypothetical protein